MDDPLFRQIWQEARQFWYKKQYQKAVYHYEKLLEHSPENPKLNLELGSLFLECHCPKQARQHLSQTLIYEPLSYKAQIRMAMAWQMQGDLDKAKSAYEKSKLLSPDDLTPHFGLLGILQAQGEWKKGLDYLKILEEIYPDELEILISKAGFLISLRHYKSAYDLLTPYLESQSTHPILIDHYTSACLGLNRTKEPIPYLNHLLKSTESAPQYHRNVHFHLGEIHDRLGEPHKAFPHFKRANALKPMGFNQTKHQEFSQIMKGIFTPMLSKSKTSPPHIPASPQMIFIVGMPRSGSSLIEQILSSHPQVTAWGEQETLSNVLNKAYPTLLSFDTLKNQIESESPQDLLSSAQKYIELSPKLLPDTSFATDKMLLNYLYLGFISRIFPQAKIIHSLRHPLDICFSAYTQNFSYLEFSNDLDVLGNYYLRYFDLMSHWKQISDLSILDFSYEALVTHQEKKTKELLAFCGLDWAPECLDFHLNSREVNTASQEQVKHKLYSSSIGRYRAYQADLEPLAKQLKPCIDWYEQTFL